MHEAERERAALFEKERVRLADATRMGGFHARPGTAYESAYEREGLTPRGEGYEYSFQGDRGEHGQHGEHGEYERDSPYSRGQHGEYGQYGQHGQQQHGEHGEYGEHGQHGQHGRHEAWGAPQYPDQQRYGDHP